MKFLLLLSLFLTSPFALAVPAQILIIRHAEKPLGEEGIHLSAKGQARAKALADFFTDHAEMNNKGLPVGIFAASPKKVGGSVRPYETVLPLSKKIGVRIDRSFKSGEENQIAEEILNNPEYEGQTIIICWVRDELPLLAYALGVQETVQWPSSVFNRVWKLTFNKKNEALLKEIPQNLLPGD